jgi:hypothetical protein
MQCASCRFENMPGVEACGRCGSPLGLGNLAVDVHPPRAAPWVKRMRRLLPFRSAYYEARDAGRNFVRESGLRDAWRIQLPGTFAGVFGRAIVPGWPQFYLGQPTRGRFFLYVYLVFMFLFFLLYGTTFGSLLLGFAFAIHVASCVSVLHLGGLRGGAYWTGVFAAFLSLAFVVYAPAGWLFSRAASPAEIRHNAPPFEYGDVLLYSPATYWFRDPQVGDVVLYDQRGGNFPLAPPQHGYIRVDGGQRIDRILAGPGDRILWEEGKLTVNGQPSTLQPLNLRSRLPRLALEIPRGSYFILPTAGGPDPLQGLSGESLHELVVVPSSSIQGRVFLRSFPFTRIQRIH